MTSRNALPLVLLALAGCGGVEPAPQAPAPSPPSCPAPAASSAAVAPPTAAPAKAKVDAVADELVRKMNAGDAAAVVALYGPAMREALPVDKTESFVRGLLGAKGALSAVEREPGEGSAHHGYYRVKAARGEWALDLTVDDAGRVLGMSITEPPAPDPPVARSAIPLALPLEGPFLVFWGGDRLEVNHHVNHKSQRRAADVVVLGPDGKTHRGDGTKNTDYFVYGKEVLSVADGTVVTVIDGVPDNEPGTMNPYFTTGNLVVVKHEGSLHSAYAHLVPGKTRVKPGVKVKRGQVLGLIGNTGNSSEPHLHFQLQDGPRFESSYGVEAVFGGVTVKRDGEAKKIAEYTFMKGDLVGEAR